MCNKKILKPGELCSCGKVHVSSVQEIAVGRGAIERLPEFVKGITPRRRLS